MILALDLLQAGYQAFAHGAERPEAAEVLFFCYCIVTRQSVLKDCLTIAKTNDPKYLTWEILLWNEQGNNLATVLALYDDGRIPLDAETTGYLSSFSR